MNKAFAQIRFSTPPKPVALSDWLLLFSFAAFFFLCGCGPKIYSFTAEALTVPVADSARLHWKMRGEPTLFVHEKDLVTGNTTRKILEFTLVAEKGSKPPVRAFLQVEITLGQRTDTLSLTELSLEGDSVLVAKGTKSPARWTAFEVVKLASASGRELRVLHESRTDVLDAAGSFSQALTGLPYSGTWELRSPLTEEEKKDHSKLPAVLEIKAIVQPKK